MKIAFDARYIEKEGSGVSAYAFHILKHLGNEQDIQITPITLQDKKSLLPGNIKEDPVISPHRLQKHPGQDIWMTFSLPSILKKRKIDLLFCPAFIIPLIKPSFKLAVMIHDLAFHFAPHSMPIKFSLYARFLTQLAVKKADIILTGTEAVKKEIFQIYSSTKDNVFAVHHGLTVENKKDPVSFPDFLQKKGISFPYLLFVGNLEPRKDIVRLISLFQLLRKDPSFKDLQLVLCGKKKWKWKDCEKKIENTDGVVFTGYVEQEYMGALYKNCLAVLATSLYEGFGLPVLEGMLSGCTVLASDIPSFREVGGEGALYIDLNNMEKSFNIVTDILKNTKKREVLAQTAQKKAMGFSWKQSAESTAQILRKHLP